MRQALQKVAAEWNCCPRILASSLLPRGTCAKFSARVRERFYFRIKFRRASVFGE